MAKEMTSTAAEKLSMAVLVPVRADGRNIESAHWSAALEALWNIGTAASECANTHPRRSKWMHETAEHLRGQLCVAQSKQRVMPCPALR
jgi:hypothetical protein